MAMTSRERVTRCLRFEGPDRTPRDLWSLPWADAHLPAEMAELRRSFPPDLGSVPSPFPVSARVRGDPYGIGEYTDDWGCTFTGIQKGVIGEVHRPLINDIGDWRSVRPPFDSLPQDLSAARDAVNRECAKTDRFCLPPCFARPWERYQFIRTTENAMVDVMLQEDGVRELISRIHEYYLREMEFWVSTDVDAVFFMDDWGAQRQLLIPPPVWRELFKPCYRDYCALAHAHGKFAFMHSDGYITEIYPDLVDVGVDALNSQLFCMDMAELARIARGRLTFWGEIDRQHVLPNPDPNVAREAVRKVARHLYDPAGGVIAQFEASPGSSPASILAIFDEWNKIDAETRATPPTPGMTPIRTGHAPGMPRKPRRDFQADTRAADCCPPAG